MKEQFLAAFKRAARRSPIHTEVIIYEVAIKDGKAVVDSEGNFVYLERCTTFGYIDLEAEDQFTVPECPYVGAVAITVLHADALDLRHMLKMGETVYAIEAVRGGDAVGLAVKVTARAVAEPLKLRQTLAGFHAP